MISLPRPLLPAFVWRALVIGAIAVGVAALASRLGTNFNAVVESHGSDERVRLEHRLTEPALKAAERNTQVTRVALAKAISGGDRAAIESLGRALIGLHYHDATPDDSIAQIEVRLASGALTYRIPDRALPTGSLYWIALPLENAGGEAGTLAIGTHLPGVRADLAAFDAARDDAERGVGAARLGFQVAVATALASVGAIVLYYWSRRRHRPVTQLIDSAQRLSGGDYTLPVTQPRRRGPLGELANALEDLRHRLSQSTISRDYHDTVLNSMNDAVLVTSKAGHITRVNAAAEALTGYTEQELQGRDLADLLDDLGAPKFEVSTAASEARETTLRVKAGQGVPVSLSGSVIRSSENSEDGFIFVARNISDRKRAERRIHYLARHDALTRLPNRMQFQHLLQQMIARSAKTQTRIIVLYLDVDRFKDVNDTFGHAAGDRTLEILSERLARAVPRGSILGRLAGDEFAIVIQEPAAADYVRASVGTLARHILDDVSRAFFLNSNEIYLTASIGIACFPVDSTDTLDLIRNADAAMYYAKRGGGNAYAFYAPEMNAAAVERLMLKSKLRRSVERDEFVLRYLPKIDIVSGRIAGAEALLRWRLPGHGDIAPAHFIPLAEETNLILPIGEWVLRKVCTDYSSWLRHVENPGRISINLSLRQLRTASFLTRCRSVFREAGVNPDCFELEITETTLMNDAKTTVPLLTELHDMGIHLSIDDFGTGYSSLSALQQMPVGTLKMDQSFIRNVSFNKDSATLVRTIIEMGRNLGMEVVAEGVESNDQLAFLRDRGCHYVQGRLFGEPLTGDELLALLEGQERGVYPFARYFGVLQSPARLPT
jgi:diguanylate cyclase (GGDEF)-like protein/PAS domain S-box-containing protein